MKNVLVLGSNGMLGNCIKLYFENKGLNFDYTTRNGEGDSFILDVDKNPISQLEYILGRKKYNYIINCIAITNIKNVDPYKVIMVNSYFPRILEYLSKKNNTKVIHISTNGIFSGKKGNYKKNEIPDETNLYGVSKYLGEIKENQNLTIRTSLIGIEKHTNNNLLNWFLLQSEELEIKGFSNILWNGITTLTLSKIIYKIIKESLDIKGLIQLTSEKTDKYQLLLFFNEIFNKNIKIIKDKSLKEDRTLIATNEKNIYFKELIKPIKQQIKELKDFYKN